jgi:hypothetical protein
MAACRASPEIAATAAAAAVMKALYPEPAAPALAGRIAALSRLPDNEAAAIALGRACAEAILKIRATDNAATAAAPPFLGRAEPGRWRPTPPALAPGLLPGWGHVRPWAVRQVDTLVPPPPALGSFTWLENYNAVKSLGSKSGASFSDDQGRIALFWADDEGTETPPGHWIAIARTLAASRGGDVVDHARLFALLGVTLADTATVVWAAKYRYGTWRPVTAVREADRLGDPHLFGDTEWTPFLATPPFPEYPSGHSAFSAGAARVLATVLGRDDIGFDAATSSTQLAGATRHYDRISDAAEEAGLSRIYGGIHFYFSHRAAAATGQAIADEVLASRFRPLRK